MINNVVLMGRLTATPELKTLQNGAMVTSFCIAVERRYQQAGAERQSDFINCVAWRSTAEFICRYFGKGDMLAVTGEIQTRRWQDQNGSSRISTEIIVDNASFCGGKNNNETKQQENNVAEPKNTTSGFVPDWTDDDLPF